MHRPNTVLGVEPIGGVSKQHTRKENETMSEERTVFERLNDVVVPGRGITLSFSDVYLLTTLLGDALDKAEADYETWRDVFDEYERMKDRER